MILYATAELFLLFSPTASNADALNFGTLNSCELTIPGMGEEC